MLGPFLIPLLFAASAGASESCQVLKSYPHDPGAFTEGLELHDGHLIEGTGLKGSSVIRISELETGKVLRLRKYAARYFGEGITVWKNRIYALTYDTHVGFVYDLATLRQLRSFDHSFLHEGWGMTHDEKSLIMSDGTEKIRFVDPESLRVTREISVTENGKPVLKVNELEWIASGGHPSILANVFETARIIRIDPLSGRVVASFDCSPIAQLPQNRDRGVLNGIAYDSKSDRVFVTGKNWPKLYQVQLQEN